MTRQSCDGKTPFNRLPQSLRPLAMTRFILQDCHGQSPRNDAIGKQIATKSATSRNDAYAPKNKPTFIVKHNIINALYCAKLYRLNQG